jgi:hypothetical protein
MLQNVLDDNDEEEEETKSISTNGHTTISFNHIEKT